MQKQTRLKPKSIKACTEKDNYQAGSICNLIKHKKNLIIPIIEYIVTYAIDINCLVAKFLSSNLHERSNDLGIISERSSINIHVCENTNYLYLNRKTLWSFIIFWDWLWAFPAQLRWKAKRLSSREFEPSVRYPMKKLELTDSHL